mmetsp:Transcript_628/g.722  ORF Transcript_628/g.722 Transcript_628/m.722 type:complete len:121 (+) Transcript_628:81-443(+)
MLLLAFLASMFNNRYRRIIVNLDFLKRLTIIKLKNSSSFDLYLGGITTSFFPINTILLPFILPIIIFRSVRLNDFILKSQYTIMVAFYCMIALFFSVFVIPLMYLKSGVNAIFYMMYAKR